MAIGAEVILANTYHLWMRPGEDIVREAGGLQVHELAADDFTAGPFQVFSLSDLRHITEEGISCPRTGPVISWPRKSRCGSRLVGSRYCHSL